MQTCSTLTIDLASIDHNLKLLSANLGHIMVMVKANAYGSDPIFLSHYLQKKRFPPIAFLGVSHVEEGVRLRKAGIFLPIFVILATPFEAETIVAHKLTPAVSSMEEALAIHNMGEKWQKIVPVHLHLDTGMHRAGVSLKDAMSLYTFIRSSPFLKLEGIMTHFAAAESTHLDIFTRQQIDVFKSFLDSLPALPRWIHAASSCAAVRFTLPFCNLARIGLGLMGYGVCLKESKPVFQLKTYLAAINNGYKGESVGYNCTYTVCRQEEKIGVIPFGYHDGFRKSISGKGYVLIHGKKAPIIGTICMDFMMIDLTEIPEVRIGDEVFLFNSQVSPEEVAAWAQMDVRELLANLSLRIKREWINHTISKEDSIRKGHDTGSKRLPNTSISFKEDSPTR
jgi:alanine racemase/UDP-N-acetylmuramoyl-tripeptide--D-alanyl-D-alanine ligase